MKKEYKAVIASVMVLALCLCAVGGVTYSWFSDTEQADVTITAGKIDLTVGDETVYMQSYGGSEKTLTDGAQESTDLGGSVTYTKNTANDSTKFTVVFTNAAPGDSIRIHVGDITLKNTINVKYNETYSVETLTGADPTLKTPFKVDGLTGIINATAQTDADAAARVIVDAHDIVISIPTTIGSEYMGASYKVTIMFNAYQSNAPLPSSGGTTTTATVAQGSAVDVKIAASDSAAIEGVGIKVESSANIPAQTLTVSDSAMQSDDAYTLSQSTTVLAGIEVTSSLGGNALENIPTTITFTLKGDWTGQILTVYHGTEKFGNDVTVTPQMYDSTNNVTTISVTTSEGFSPYFVTTKSVAIINGTGYATLEKAVNAARSGDTIVLLKSTTENYLHFNTEKNVKILFPDGIKLETKGLLVSSGEVCLEGNGTIVSDDIPIWVYTDADNSSVDDAKLIVGDGITIETGHDYSIAMNYAGENVGYGAEIVIDGATLNGGVYVQGRIQNTSDLSKITLCNSTITGMNYIAGNIKFEASNTEFVNNATPLMFKAGDVAVKNCTFRMTKASSITPIYISTSNGTTSVNAFVAIEDKAGYVGMKSALFMGNTFECEGSVTNLLYATDSSNPIEIEGSTESITYVFMKKTDILNYIDGIKFEFSDGTQATCTMYFDTAEKATEFYNGYDKGSYYEGGGETGIKYTSKGTLHTVTIAE